MPDGPHDNRDALLSQIADLRTEVAELRQHLGEEVISPFPDAAVDGFLSHFVFTIQLARGDLAGQLISITLDPAVQTVSRSRPFIYRGYDSSYKARLPIPAGCTLDRAISEDDFLVTPREYFQEGKETVWMQILNLDASGETPIGRVRVILGETLKQEYPELYLPSHGVAQSLGPRGFPARLFFNPVAVCETPVGAFRAIHGTLAYGRITAFPPIGTPVTLREANPLEAVDDLREAQRTAAAVAPAGQVLALGHPIDAALNVPGDQAFNAVQSRIATVAGRG